jgi:ectoine hydroxylase-related dioxygenase (phytanoyl-CoA dioxygenase family)
MVQAVEATEPERAAAIVAADGVVVIRRVAEPPLLAALRPALEICLAEDAARFGPGHRFPGMVHALPARGAVFLDYLELPGFLQPMRRLLGHGCIVQGYNSSCVPPRGVNYAREIHVDSPRWIPGYITNVTAILAIDAFTEETGGIEIVAAGFRSPDSPTLEGFEADFERPQLAAGDVLMFNSRCWHRSGVNRTERWRHGISATLCRAYMRQQFDFPRMLDAAGIRVEHEGLRQILGWYVRMPTSLDEFLLPADQRPYRPGQE